jgi:hypothetical protein
MRLNEDEFSFRCKRDRHAFGIGTVHEAGVRADVAPATASRHGGIKKSRKQERTLKPDSRGLILSIDAVAIIGRYSGVLADKSLPNKRTGTIRCFKPVNRDMLPGRWRRSRVTSAVDKRAVQFILEDATIIGASELNRPIRVIYRRNEGFEGVGI